MFALPVLEVLGEVQQPDLLNSVDEYNVERCSMQPTSVSTASRIASHSSLERPWAIVNSW